jgi:hypothetical protein
MNNRSAWSVVGISLLVLILVLASALQCDVQAACAVNCLGSQCYQNFAQNGSKDVVVVINGAVANLWLVSTTGCPPANCQCTGTGSLVKVQLATGTPPCNPIQVAPADVPIPAGKAPTDVCTNPRGAVSQFNACAGCTATGS